MCTDRGMTAGAIVDGPVAGNAANSGTPALPGKLAGAGRTGGGNTIERASKTVAGLGSPVGTASPRWRAVSPSGSSVAELHTSWKEEFQDQASRLVEANDASDAFNPKDLNEFSRPADAPAAASSAAAPGSRALREGALTPSFPAGGQDSGQAKAVALQPKIAGHSSGGADGNGSSPDSSRIPALPVPAPAFSALQIGASRQSSSSTRVPHGSGPQHTPNSHSASSAPALSPAPVSATASLPVASPVLTVLAVPAPVAGNCETEEPRAIGARAVSEVGSLAASAVFPADSGQVSTSSVATSDVASRSEVGPPGKPLEQASLGPNGAVAPLFGNTLNERVVPGRATFDSPTPIGKARFSGIDLPIAEAQPTTNRETVSSPPDSRNPGRSAPQNTPDQEAASLQVLLHGTAQESSVALSSTPVQPNVQALLQLHGAASATIVGNPREASVSSASGAPRVPANQDPVSFLDSGSVRVGAAHAEAPSAIGASNDSATNPEGVRPPGAETLLAASWQHPPAVATASSASGVPGTGDHPPILVSAFGAEHLAGTTPAEFLGREAANMASVSSATISSRGRLASFASSIGKRDSGSAQGASLHTSGSTAATVSFSHSGLVETDIATAEGFTSAVRQGSGAGSVGSNRNSSGSSEIFDLMDQSPVQAAGRDSLVAAASSATGAVRALQVGYQDPVLGYVELRAHSGANGVHATLEAQSATAGDTLAGHLSALAGWMDERRTPLESLTVSTLLAQPDSGLAQHGRDSAASGQDGGARAGNGGAGDGGQGGSFRPNPAPSLGIEPGLAVAQPLAPHGGAGSFAVPALPGGSSFSAMA